MNEWTFAAVRIQRVSDLLVNCDFLKHIRCKQWVHVHYDTFRKKKEYPTNYIQISYYIKNLVKHFQLELVTIHKGKIPNECGRGISSGPVYLISFVKMTPHPLSNQWVEWTAFPTCDVETMHMSFSSWLISRRQDNERNRCCPIRSFYFIKQPVEEGRSRFFKAGNMKSGERRKIHGFPIGIFINNTIKFIPSNIWLMWLWTLSCLTLFRCVLCCLHMLSEMW